MVISCVLIYENLLAVLDKMEPISDLRDYQKFIDKSLNALKIAMKILKIYYSRRGLESSFYF